MRWPWQWFRCDDDPPAALNGTAAAAAELKANQKLDETIARRREVQRAVNTFAEEVEAALRRRAQ